jgi:drug/metabolite transporter (DMT)-like permease
MQKNQYLNGIITGIFGAISFLVIKYLFSREVDFFTTIVFAVVFAVTYILSHKFFGKK